MRGEAVSAVPFTPGRAVEAQDELARFLASPTGLSFTAGVGESRSESGYFLVAKDPLDRARWELSRVLGARTYLVTADMLAVKVRGTPRGRAPRSRAGQRRSSRGRS